MVNKTVLICAGGTGGHIIPGLSIAKELQKKNYTIHWLGTKLGLESTLVPKNNIPINYINISGLRGKSWKTLFLAPFKLFLSLYQAMKIIYNVKPSLVIGMGGFVTGPSCIAAWLLGKKIIIHEQNSIPGTTNKILQLFANTVLEGFPDSFKGKKNVHFVGNPIREEFAEIKNFLQTKHLRLQQATLTLNLLVIGGSRGAMTLNNNIPTQVHKCKNVNFNIWHQTGKNNLTSTQQKYQSYGIRAKTEEFIEDIAKAYLWADLVISRSGALTVAELAASSTASILVPFKHAIDNHQYYNAKYLEGSQAAIIMSEEELKTDKLSSLLLDLYSNKNKLYEMAKSAQNKANLASLIKVTNHCTELLQS